MRALFIRSTPLLNSPIGQILTNILTLCFAVKWTHTFYLSYSSFIRRQHNSDSKAFEGHKRFHFNTDRLFLTKLKGMATNINP